MPRQLIGGVLGDTADAVIAKLPTVSNIAGSVARYRRKAKCGHSSPASLSDLVIDQEYVKTIKGEDFRCRRYSLIRKLTLLHSCVNCACSLQLHSYTVHIFVLRLWEQ